MTDAPPPPSPDDLPPPPAGAAVQPPNGSRSGRSTGPLVLAVLVVLVAAVAIVLWVLRSPTSDSADPVDSIPPIPTATADGSDDGEASSGTDAPDATSEAATRETDDSSPETLAPAPTIVVEAPPTSEPDPAAGPTTTLPPGPPEIVVPFDGASIAEILEASPGLARTAELVIVAEARDDLDAADELYTLLAPTNAAIDALLATDERYGQLDDPVLLRELLDRHLLTDAIDLDTLLSLDEVRALSGETLAIGDGTVGGAVVVTGDVVAGNGVIHVIDAIAVATG